MLTADTIPDEGPPAPTRTYLRRVLRHLVDERRWQAALDFTDLMAVHPHVPAYLQEWLNGFGDAMHMIICADISAMSARIAQATMEAEAIAGSLNARGGK